MHVAFAKVGAKLFTEEGVKSIEKTTIRGCESEGMLCSAKELGISDDHSKIYELSSDIPLGEDLTLSLWDPVLDIALTPNLGHCMSVLGIARELSAFLNKPLRLAKLQIKESSDKPALSAKVMAHEFCKKYAYRTIKNIQIAPSPFSLRRKIELLGLRPINNVVDITNRVP